MLGTDEDTWERPTSAHLIFFMTSDPCPITTSTIQSAFICHCQCDEEMPVCMRVLVSQHQSHPASPLKQGGFIEEPPFLGKPAFISREGRGPTFSSLTFSQSSASECWDVQEERPESSTSSCRQWARSRGPELGNPKPQKTDFWCCWSPPLCLED